MAFVSQSSAGKFVSWGKEKKDVENPSYVVKKGESVEGLVTKLKHSDTYGKILELKVKDVEEGLIITGTTLLNRELGYEWDDKQENMLEITGVKTVVTGDVIRITFNGMIPVKGGKEAYDLSVEVDR